MKPIYVAFAIQPHDVDTSWFGLNWLLVNSWHLLSYVDCTQSTDKAQIVTLIQLPTAESIFIMAASCIGL